MKSNLLNGISRTLHNVGFIFKKNSPEILLGVGVVGVVTTTVMACKATTKATEVLENHKKELDQVNKCEEQVKQGLIPVEEYPEAQYKKDVAIVYTSTIKNLVKLYGPTVLVGAGSLAAILASHGIMSKRNAALTTAYTAISNGYKEYRKRVVDRFGEKTDKELLYNVKAKEVETIDIDENGNEVHGKKTVDAVDKEDALKCSPYAKFFDESSVYFEKNAKYNLSFLKNQERWANQRLQAVGYLYWNEVLDALGIDRVPLGQTHGWVYDKTGKDTVSNYVDFGITDLYDSAKHEPVILLNFNCDGYILNKMN